MKRGVLVAGANGVLGREVIQLLSKRSNHAIRALCHHASEIPSLQGWAQEIYSGDASDDRVVHGLCRGVRYVISCLGMDTQWHSSERRSFHEIDTAANENLIAEAKDEGVEKFIYVSPHREEVYSHTHYMRAHEEVVLALEASHLDYTIIRSTDLFPSLIPFTAMARWGIVPVLGDGSARMNPVHPADVAALCVAALGDDARERDIGGPEELTRLQVAQMIASTTKHPLRVMRIAPWCLRLGRPLIAFRNARQSELMEYVLLAGSHDCLAPFVGTHKFRDYLEQVVRRWEGWPHAA